MQVKDSNGNLLKEGDSVTRSKNLYPKEIRGILKRGQVVKTIRFTDNKEEIEERIDKVMMVLKTCFLKKA